MYESNNSGFTLFGIRIQTSSDGLLPQIQAKSEAFLFKDYSSEVTNVAAEGPRKEDSAKVDKASAFGESDEENKNTVQPNEEQTNSGTKDDQAESSNTEQEKTLKKPDKIIPCPRCNSLDTKFCYFNNYNVNQPRYFCKNCQRYWTAGGTMRSVPVGAGRRKNKHLASQYRQILGPSDGIPGCTIEGHVAANRQLISCDQSENAFRPSTGNGTVLKFGPDAPLCESMGTVLNIRGQKSSVEMGSASFVRSGEELSSCVSSMTTSSVPRSELPSEIMQKGQVDLPGSGNEIFMPHPMHCHPATPWVFPCNPAQYPSQQVNSSNPNEVQFCPTPMLAVPGFYPTSIPLHFVPASYWDCMSLLSVGTGTMPLTGSGGCTSPSSSTSNSCCLGNISPTLGKHGRDVNFMDEEKPEKCIIVPRTLRVDDPDEASRSPIWASLGIKHSQADSLRKGTIFRSFKSKANVVALSRSQKFHESV